MAKKTVLKKEGGDIKTLVIQEINQVNVDRTPKDVRNWRDAHRIAENVHNPNRSRLLDLYADVDLDGHFTGVWAKRRGATTKKKLIYQGAKGKKVDAFDDLIAMKKFRDLKKLILDYKTWSQTGAQFIPGKMFDWIEIPKKHILLEKGLIKINQNDQTGRPYKDDPWIMVYGDANDLGLLLKVSFYALIKKGNFADWAQYSEIFGQPIRVVKYDAFDDKTRIQLKQVLDESGSSLALMIPKQADFEIMDGKTSNGNGDLQDKLKTACNNEISIIILGNTETSTNENGGSNAKAEVQDEGEDDLKDDDCADMLSYLNDAKFQAILANYGYPVEEGGKFVVQETTDVNKIKAAAEAIKAMKDAEIPVDDDTAYDLTGVSKPANYDQLKAEKEASNKLLKESLNGNKKAFKQDSEDDEPEDLTDNIWNRIRTKLADFFDPPR